MRRGPATPILTLRTRSLPLKRRLSPEIQRTLKQAVAHPPLRALMVPPARARAALYFHFRSAALNYAKLRSATWASVSGVEFYLHYYHALNDACPRSIIPSRGCNPRVMMENSLRSNLCRAALRCMRASLWFIVLPLLSCIVRWSRSETALLRSDFIIY